MNNVLEYLKTHDKVFVEDQLDTEKEYGLTWKELEDFEDYIYCQNNLISDSCDEHGFETCIFEGKYEDYTIKLEIVYGIGSFSIMSII
jgi:hypothetical protein